MDNLLVAPVSYRWYVLNVIASAQANVCKRARELEFETYYPLSRVQPAPKPGRRLPAVVTRPLMPGYVFVLMSARAPRFDLFEQPDSDISRPNPMPLNVWAGYVADQASRPMLEPIRGCLGFIAHEGAPIPVPDTEIEDMRTRERNGDFDLTGRSEDGRYLVRRWVKRGVPVRFVTGPFTGYLGVIDKVLGKSLVRVDRPAGHIDAPMDWIERVR